MTDATRMDILAAAILYLAELGPAFTLSRFKRHMRQRYSAATIDEAMLHESRR